jgi:hypothetical protein
MQRERQTREKTLEFPSARPDEAPRASRRRPFFLARSERVSRSAESVSRSPRVSLGREAALGCSLASLRESHFSSRAPRRASVRTCRAPLGTFRERKNGLAERPSERSERRSSNRQTPDTDRERKIGLAERPSGRSEGRSSNPQTPDTDRERKNGLAERRCSNPQTPDTDRERKNGLAERLSVLLACLSVLLACLSVLLASVSVLLACLSELPACLSVLPEPLF